MHSTQGSQKIVLGEVSTPSGTVLLIDFGLMYLWTHERPPLIPEGILEGAALEAANGAFDCRIEGDDALAAGKSFARQANPLYLYDIPHYGLSEIKENFKAHCLENGYRAELKELPERVSPLKRVEQAFASAPGQAALVFLHGIQALALTGLPQDKVLQVEGQTVGDGKYADCWKHVSLIIKDDAEIATSCLLGYVTVDMARLMFCDLSAAGSWVHDESIDGLADFVFWGRDAERLAKRFKAPKLDANSFGFLSMPIEQAAEIAFQVQEHLDRHRLVAACDFRPHSDHWRMLTKLSLAKCEAGVIDLAQTKCCGFMTSWGDGCFSVFLDLAEDRSPLRLRIELGTEETLKGMKLVNRFA